MANTYTQIHIQLVFAVKYREALISSSWNDRLYKYITGIIQNNDHKMLRINGMPDHIHIFFGMRPSQSISSLVQNVKSESSKWINEEHLTKKNFRWQEGFGAFSYAKSQVPNVIQYIKNQEQHHKKIPFLTEYQQMLDLFGVDYDQRFIFVEPV